MKIYIGADHAGFELKEKIKAYLGKLDFEFQDMGNIKLDKKDDYPDFCSKVAEAVARILIVVVFYFVAQLKVLALLQIKLKVLERLRCVVLLRRF